MLYKVQVGAFAVKSNAEKVAKTLKEQGFSAIIVESQEEAKITGAEKIYEVMKPYIDSKTAHKDFVTQYNKMMEELGHSKITTKNAWCAMFVDMCFWLAGYLDLIGYGKRSVNLMENAKKKGTWKSGSDDIKFGDVVIFQDSKGEPNHTEFALGGKKFVSGNMNGGVHIRTRSNFKTVKGRIRPKY